MHPKTAPEQHAVEGSQVSHNLALQIAEEVVRRVGLISSVGRASYTVAEVAARNGVSTRHIYNEIAAQKLIATRPGDGTLVRITPRDESLWLCGKSSSHDQPALGIAQTAS